MKQNNEYLKISNELLSVGMNGLKGFELDLWFMIVALVTDSGTKLQKFKLKELSKFAKVSIGHQSNLDLEGSLKNVIKKVTSDNSEIINQRTNKPFFLNHFSTLEVTDDGELKVQVSKEFEKLYNNVNSKYSTLDLNVYWRMRSFYAKEFYKCVIRFRSTGVWRVTLEDFRRLLSVPDYFTPTHIKKTVIKPGVISLLKEDKEGWAPFKSLDVHPVIKRGTKTKVIGYVIYFKVSKAKTVETEAAGYLENSYSFSTKTENVKQRGKQNKTFAVTKNTHELIERPTLKERKTGRTRPPKSIRLSESDLALRKIGFIPREVLAEDRDFEEFHPEKHPEVIKELEAKKRMEEEEENYRPSKALSKTLRPSMRLQDFMYWYFKSGIAEDNKFYFSVVINGVAKIKKLYKLLVVDAPIDSAWTDVTFYAVLLQAIQTKRPIVDWSFQDIYFKIVDKHELPKLREEYLDAVPSQIAGELCMFLSETELYQKIWHNSYSYNQ